MLADLRMNHQKQLLLVGARQKLSLLDPSLVKRNHFERMRHGKVKLRKWILGKDEQCTVHIRKQPHRTGIANSKCTGKLTKSNLKCTVHYESRVL